MLHLEQGKGRVRRLAEEMSSKLTTGSPVFDTGSNTWLSVQQDISHERPTEPCFNLGFYCCEKKRHDQKSNWGEKDLFGL